MSVGYAIAPASAALFNDADAKYAELRTAVTSEMLAGMAHDDVERYLENEGRELLRLLYQDHITLRGLEIAAEPVLGADGVILSRSCGDAIDRRQIGSSSLIVTHTTLSTFGKLHEYLPSISCPDPVRRTHGGLPTPVGSVCVGAPWTEGTKTQGSRDCLDIYLRHYHHPPRP